MVSSLAVAVFAVVVVAVVVVAVVVFVASLAPAPALVASASGRVGESRQQSSKGCQSFLHAYKSRLDFLQIDLTRHAQRIQFRSKVTDSWTVFIDVSHEEMEQCALLVDRLGHLQLAQR